MNAMPKRHIDEDFMPEINENSRIPTGRKIVAYSGFVRRRAFSRF